MFSVPPSLLLHLVSVSSGGAARKPDSLDRLLSYPIPLLYHDLEAVSRDLARELQQYGLPPIISLEDFM